MKERPTRLPQAMFVNSTLPARSDAFDVLEEAGGERHALGVLRRIFLHPLSPPGSHLGAECRLGPESRGGLPWKETPSLLPPRCPTGVWFRANCRGCCFPWVMFLFRWHQVKVDGRGRWKGERHLKAALVPLAAMGPAIHHRVFSPSPLYHQSSTGGQFTLSPGTSSASGAIGMTRDTGHLLPPPSITSSIPHTMSAMNSLPHPSPLSWLLLSVPPELLYLAQPDAHTSRFPPPHAALTCPLSLPTSPCPPFNVMIEKELLCDKTWKSGVVNPSRTAVLSPCHACGATERRLTWL